MSLESEFLIDRLRKEFENYKEETDKQIKRLEKRITILERKEDDS